MSVIWQAAGELAQHALELGGTLTGEHGVDQLERRRPCDALGADQLAPQHKITAVFGPTGSLNPERVLAPMP